MIIWQFWPFLSPWIRIRIQKTPWIRIRNTDRYKWIFWSLGCIWSLRYALYASEDHGRQLRMTVLSDDYDKMIKLPCCGSALWGYASAGYPQGRSCCTAGTQPTRRVLKNKKTRKKTSCQNSPKSYFLKNNAYHLFNCNINTVDWLVATFYLQQFKTDWWIGCTLFYLQKI